MANSRQTDVSLVIKARDEASKAVNAIDSAFQQFVQTQRKVASGAESTASGLGQLVTVAANLDRAYSQVAGAADTGAAALKRQADALVANKAQLASLQQQSQGAAAALDSLATKLVDVFLNKGDPGPLRARMGEVRAEMARLDNEAAKLGRTIAQQESNFTRSASTLGELERNTKLVSAVTVFAKQEADDYTRSLNAQNVAAERAASLRAAIARSTDATSGKSAQLSADVFRSQGLTNFERAVQAENDRAAAIARTNAELVEQGRLQAAISKLTQTSGISAKDTGLAQQLREEEKAAKAAEVALEQEAAALAELRANLDPLAAVTARQAAEQAKLNKWFREGKISATELAHAEKLLAIEADNAANAIKRQGGGANAKPQLFGLKPYEIQNLGFQINDIFTQLASGTSLTQTLAQQGGQLLQIFPRVGSSIVAAFSNPAILAAAVAVGAFAVGISDAADRADRLRGFLGTLAATADGGSYGAEKLNAAAEALDKYGLSAEEAVKAVRIFIKEGVDQGRIEEFGRTATDLAEVMGVDLKDAAEEVAKAFTGGYDAIKKLDDSYNFLTASQRENIRVLFDEGRAAEARNEALRIFSDQQEDAANKMRGPWAAAVRELSAAWQEFKTFLAESEVIKSVSGALEGLAKASRQVIRSLRGLREESDIQAEIDAYEKMLGTSFRGLFGPSDFDIRRKLGALRAELKAVQEDNDKIEASGRGQGDTIAQNTELMKKQSADLRQQLNDSKEKQSVDEAGNEARRKAQALIEKDFRFADQATKQAFIAQQVAEARAKAAKRIADETEREARAAKRAADERRKGFVQDIQDNGREDILSTARRFEGKTETANRGDLMQFFRQNGVQVDPQMTAWCAAFVNAVLAANGFKGTGSLAARSFLNFGQDSTSNPQEGDIVILRRGNNQAQGHVGFFRGFDDKGNVRVLGGNQGNGVNTQSFNRNDVLGFRRPPTAGETARVEAQAADQLAKKQEEYRESLERTIRARTEDTEQLREQFGLQGNALLAKQREAAIEDAVRKAREDAAKAGIQAKGIDGATADAPELDTRLQKLREVIGAYFDAQHAKDKFENSRAEIQRPVDELTALRDNIQRQMQVFREAGQGGAAGQLQPQLDAVNAKLAEAVQRAQAFYAALANNPEAMVGLNLTKEQIDNIRLGLEATAISTQKTFSLMGLSGQTIAQTFSTTAVSAIDRFAEAVAGGEKVFNSLKDAFLSFASDFLRQIAQMILQQVIFNIVSSALGGLVKGAAPGAGGASPLGAFTQGWNFDPVIQFHKGGIVGRGGERRVGDASWFANAVRYHTGGIAGLRPNEIPAVLERGEEVLTRDDPRHAANGGGAGGGSATDRVKNVIYYDAAEALAAALSTRNGEKAMLTWMRANSAAIRSTG